MGDWRDKSPLSLSPQPERIAAAKREQLRFAEMNALVQRQLHESVLFIFGRMPIILLYLAKQRLGSPTSSARNAEQSSILQSYRVRSWHSLPAETPPLPGRLCCSANDMSQQQRSCRLTLQIFCKEPLCNCSAAGKALQSLFCLIALRLCYMLYFTTIHCLLISCTFNFRHKQSRSPRPRPKSFRCGCLAVVIKA